MFYKRIIIKERGNRRVNTCRFFGNISMYNELTKSDIKKMQEEIAFEEAIKEASLNN